MKKFLKGLSIVTLVILLAACGGEDNQDALKNDDNRTDEEKSNDAEAKDVGQFEEVELFELEGAVSSLNFNMNEEGDILYWGENDRGERNDQRRNVWVDGEVKELDMDVFPQSSFLTPAGIIISKEGDRNAPEGERNYFIEYDPKTDEIEKIPTDMDDIPTLLPSHGRYIQDPDFYIHTETSPNRDEESQTLYLDLEKNELHNLSFLQDVKDEVGEMTSYVYYFLNSDGSKIYGVVMEEGVFSHDVTSGETNRLLETDNIMPQDKYTNMLTSDDLHLIYGSNNPDADRVIITYHALNVETQETIELGDGLRVFTLSDGNVIIVDKNDVNLYDFEKEKLETIHTIDLEENQEIDNVTVSLDGSTISYGYSTRHDDDETTYHMSIWSNK